jgi:hypothetical protein
MHFGLREIAAVISAAALILFCSCEKHRLGEDPEAQKEQVDEGKAGEEGAAASKKSESSETAAPKRTPGEFFPETTPSP